MLISVVIRTLNEAKWIARCVQSVRCQRTLAFTDVEIIVVDSGSTDRTVSICRRLGIEPLEIRREEFTYSRALNLGFACASGELVASLSAHAIPRDEQWLAGLVRCFDNPLIGGAFSRQVPWADAPLDESIRIERMFPPGDRTVSGDTSGTPWVPFSNVSSCVRRRLWQRHPFADVPAAEDREWAEWVLEQGHSVVYAADSVVQHSHRETSCASANRLIQLCRASEARRRLAPSFVRACRQALSGVYWSSRLLGDRRHPLPKRVDCIVRSVGTSFWFLLYYGDWR